MKNGEVSPQDDSTDSIFKKNNNNKKPLPSSLSSVYPAAVGGYCSTPCGEHKHSQQGT